MSDFPVMPDRLAALERDLRAAAGNGKQASRRRAPRRIGLAVAVAAALAAALVLTLSPGGRRPSSADAEPLVLRAPTVAIPRRYRTLGFGALYAQQVNEVGRRPAAADLRALARSGRRIRTTSARSIEAFGGTAYLLGAPGVWCLVAPDPEARFPSVETGTTCAPARDFRRIGISLMVGRRYVAAVPQGVPDPVLVRADGARQTLRPDEHGLVVVEALGERESVIRTDARGRTRADGPASGTGPAGAVRRP